MDDKQRQVEIFRSARRMLAMFSTVCLNEYTIVGEDAEIAARIAILAFSRLTLVDGDETNVVSDAANAMIADSPSRQQASARSRAQA